MSEDNSEQPTAAGEKPAAGSEQAASSVEQAASTPEQAASTPEQAASGAEQTASSAEVMPAQDELNVFAGKSLEELLNMTVTTATKTERTVDVTPAMMEIITAEQIRQRGYRHLADLLQDIPDNHQDFANWGVGEPISQNVSFGYRFDTGQNILLLFNGQRLNAFLLGARFGGEEYLLESLERVEIIRGPGSALYGANAFTAVVNLISKSKLDDGESPSVNIRLDGEATARGVGGQASWATPLADKGFTSGGLYFMRERGQNRVVRNTLYGDLEGNLNAGRKMRDTVYHVLVGHAFLSYGNLRVYATANSQKRNTITGFNGVTPPEVHDGGRMELANYSLGADYTHALSDTLTLKGSVGGHFDSFNESALVPIFALDPSGELVLDPVTLTRNGQSITTPYVFDGLGGDTVTLDADLQLTWNYLDDNRIVLGANVSNDRILETWRASEIQLEPFELVEYRRFCDEANDVFFDSSATRTTIGA